MVNRQEIREHVTRLLDSEQFVTSRSVAKLLAFCVDAALAGNEETLKETTIGVFCFGRSPGYDTKQDPIVRVTARRLRNKLELFYGNQGANDGLQIMLPKGTYIPRFHHRSNQAAIAELSPDAKSMIPDPLPAADAKPGSIQKVPVETQLRVITGSSWLRPAIWSFLVFLLMTSGAVILTRFHQDVKDVAPQDNPSHLNSLAADSSVEPGAPGTERQKAAASSEKSHVHPIEVSTDDMVASVEPRL